MATAKHIVLVHGNFVNNVAWAQWKARYESRGYIVHTPANPGHGGNPADLRARVDPALGDTGFVEVYQNIERLLETLPERPLVVGHSMAGVVAMKLAEAGKVAAAVSVNGAPPKNVFPVPMKTLKTVLPSFGFFSSGKTWLGPQSWYENAFFNTLPESERDAAYRANIVPESFKVNRDLILNSFAKVDFRSPHAPLLFIGGGSDNLFPARFTERIAGKYRDPNSRVDVKVFDERSHFTCGEPGWEQVADHILDWYERI